MKANRTLVVIFNMFYPSKKTAYVEVVTKADGSCSERPLKRCPKAARFDEVLETGEGSYNNYNAHRATRVFNHPLQRQ